MTTPGRRHEHSARSALPRALRPALSALVEHPVRTLLFVLLNAFLIWLVLTKSLPYALAPFSPDTALALNPRNPEALLAKAGLVRQRLLAITGAGVHRTQRAASSGGTLAALPEAGAQTDLHGEVEGERGALRAEIRQLAEKAIANDPLNAQAYRLLAEVTDQPSRARSLMQEAVRRSRRETFAVFWLLNDAFSRKDYKAALDYADVLLRTRPELWETVFAYQAKISQDDEGRAILVLQLAGNPPWRKGFLQALPRLMVYGAPSLDVVAALKSAGAPVTGKELTPLLVHLIGINRAADAHNAWLQSLPQDQDDRLGLLTNPAFENDPNGSPFDWKIERGLNATAEISPASAGPGKRLLHVSFSGARVKFPEVSQVLLLRPGRYRLEGVLRGTINTTRGLRWQLSCAAGSRAVLGETEMLMGQTEQWRVFSLVADVPPSNCPGQLLRLFHDSRSASEEFISGEVWFSGLRLDPVQSTAEN